MRNRKHTFERIMREVHAMEKRATVGAHIILDASGEHVGTLRTSRSKSSGAVYILLADWTLPMPEDKEARETFARWQFGRATGYGYDKVRAALSGLSLCGVRFPEDSGENWQYTLEARGFRVLTAI